MAERIGLIPLSKEALQIASDAFNVTVGIPRRINIDAVDAQTDRVTVRTTQPNEGAPATQIIRFENVSLDKHRK